MPSVIVRAEERMDAVPCQRMAPITPASHHPHTYATGSVEALPVQRPRNRSSTSHRFAGSGIALSNLLLIAPVTCRRAAPLPGLSSAYMCRKAMYSASHRGSHQSSPHIIRVPGAGDEWPGALPGLRRASAEHLRSSASTGRPSRAVSVSVRERTPSATAGYAEVQGKWLPEMPLSSSVWIGRPVPSFAIWQNMFAGWPRRTGPSTADRIARYFALTEDPYGWPVLDMGRSRQSTSVLHEGSSLRYLPP